MKTLILSCNTGEGHNSCAKAIKECFEAHGESCDIVDSLLFISEKASKFICNWHVRIYRHMPNLFKVGYKDAENSVKLFEKDSLVYEYLTSGSERMYDYILENGYDCVVCTHIFPALALGDMLEKHSLPLVTAFIATDYTCSPGAGETDLQYCFIPDESLREEFAACGVPSERIVASGIPARSEFYMGSDKESARRSIGVYPAHTHALMMCGSMGCGPIPELTRCIAERLSPVQELTIICGSNEKLYEKLQVEYLMRPNIHVRGRVEDMPLYMRAADLYITKPGGLSTTEAAAVHLPMLLIDAVAGCEEHNLDFFVKKGGAVTADTPEGLAEAALELLSDPEKLKKMSQTLAGIQRENPAELIYRKLKSHAEKNN